ncbi:MAG: hypothetical protein ACKVZ6_24100 [Kineosporiaceae bacterium]
MARRRRGPGLTAIVVTLAASVAAAPLAGCSAGAGQDSERPGPTTASGASGASTQQPAQGSTTSTASGSSAPTPTATRTPGATGTPPAAAGHPLFPLTVGFQSVRQGAVTKGSRRLEHRLVFTVTDVTKKIDGLTAVAALDQDIDGGELAEQSLEFFAIDHGALRYMGSYTETYEGGQFVNATDAWLSGVRGGRSGTLLPAAPKVGSPAFTEAFVPGEGAASGKVVKTGQRTCVPFRCFTDVVVVEEDGSELKYYAPGVGGIRTEPLSGDPQETEELVNVTALSRQGLAEISAEVLRLDEHARTVSRSVYGGSAPASRR